MAMPKSLTKDGFEMQLGVNHLGHFLLTNLLLNTMKASAPSRIIVVSSLAHRFGVINREDLNSDKSYNKFKAYSQSKLANILFTRELARRLRGTGVTINAVHPGVLKTELGRYMIQSHIRRVIQPFLHCVFKTPKSGAQTTLKVALDPDLKTISGKYFADCEIKGEAKSNTDGDDNELAAWLWKTSEERTKLLAHLNPV